VLRPARIAIIGIIVLISLQAGENAVLDRVSPSVIAVIVPPDSTR